MVFLLQPDIEEGIFAREVAFRIIVQSFRVSFTKYTIT